MGPWAALREELDAWSAEGRSATLWWRDDDATRASSELERLLAMSGDGGVPVALAVIPALIEATLEPVVAAHPMTSVLQHGWSHANHAPSGLKQEEYGPHRPRQMMLDELAEGWRRLSAMPRALPVLVAPWNRMEECLLEHLPGIGLRAVSTMGPRESADPAPGVRRTNVHVDIIDWHGSGGFVGEDAAVQQIRVHLRARREGEADPDEPTGLMTHHLFHDEGCWSFLPKVIGFTSPHPAVRWLDAEEAFWA